MVSCSDPERESLEIVLEKYVRKTNNLSKIQRRFIRE